MCNDDVCRDGEEYSGFINGNGKLLNGLLVGRDSGDAIPCGPFTPKTFANSISSFFTCTKMKAIILKVFEIDSSDYSSNLEFCDQIKAKFFKANPKLSCYFISSDHYWLSSMLIVANLTVDINEYLLMGILSSKTIDIFQLKFTNAGYLITDKRTMSIDKEKDHQEIRGSILANCNPKKIIMMSLSAKNPTMTFLKNVLKSPKLTAFERNRIENDGRFCQETTNWILDKKRTKFYILPSCSRKYTVSDKVDGNGTPILVAESHEALPLLKSCVIPRTTMNLSMSYTDVITDKQKVINLKKFGRKCHRYNITLNIKSKNAPVCQADAIMLPNIESLPRRINEVTKIPVIGFFDQSSVICLWNERRNAYEFLESWNGMYGNDLFLFFDREKPSFGQKAFELFQAKSASAVYDIIKVMSMSPENFKINPNWSFQIVKDTEYPILLNFLTHDGSRKEATPSFLMALMLKEHIKAIKNEIGEKPQILGFCVLDELDKKEKECIKQQIEEACELLTVECQFFDM